MKPTVIKLKLKTFWIVETEYILIEHNSMEDY